VPGRGGLRRACARPTPARVTAANRYRGWEPDGADFVLDCAARSTCERSEPNDVELSVAGRPGQVRRVGSLHSRVGGPCHELDRGGATTKSFFRVAHGVRMRAPSKASEPLRGGNSLVGRGSCRASPYQPSRSPICLAALPIEIQPEHEVERPKPSAANHTKTPAPQLAGVPRERERPRGRAGVSGRRWGYRNESARRPAIQGEPVLLQPAPLSPISRATRRRSRRHRCRRHRCHPAHRRCPGRPAHSLAWPAPRPWPPAPGCGFRRTRRGFRG